MYKLVISLYVEKEKKLSKLVISLRLTAENNAALGFWQPQNNASSIGDIGHSISHCDDPPPTNSGYKK